MKQSRGYVSWGTCSELTGTSGSDERRSNEITEPNIGRPERTPTVASGNLTVAAAFLITPRRHSLGRYCGQDGSGHDLVVSLVRIRKDLAGMAACYPAGSKRSPSGFLGSQEADGTPDHNVDKVACTMEDLHRQFVKCLYRGLFQREADEEGLNHFVYLFL